MKLDLSIEYQKSRFIAYVQKLLDKEAKVELKEYRPQRSLSQNAYLHVCFGLIAQETGFTIEEAKTVLKREFGSFLVYEKKGTKFLRSTADLDTKEMTNFIDWLRSFAMDQLGVYLPTPEEHISCAFELEKQLENVK